MNTFLFILSCCVPFISGVYLIIGYRVKRNYMDQLHVFWSPCMFPKIVYGAAMANTIVSYLFLIYVKNSIFVLVPAILTGFVFAIGTVLLLKIHGSKPVADLILTGIACVLTPLIFFIYQYANQFFLSFLH